MEKTRKAGKLTLLYCAELLLYITFNLYEKCYNNPIISKKKKKKL